MARDILIIVVVSTVLPQAAHAVDPRPAANSSTSAAFVPAFERFGRYAEGHTVADRLLLTELSCTACHTPGKTETDTAGHGLLVPKAGPDLQAVSNRVQHEWLKKYLQQPARMKPGTTMPDVLAGLPEGERASAIEALVAFLARQTKPFPEIKASGASAVPQQFWTLGDVDAGRKLYHRIGCVACHEPDPDYETVEVKPSPLDEMLQQLEPEEIQELGLAAKARPVPSVPLPDLKAKYSTQSLTYFLLDPHAVRPAGRMPRFELNVVQAADLTAWLMQMTAASDVPAPQQLDAAPQESTSAGLAAKGRRLFATLGCANCHSLKDISALQTATPLEQLQADAAISCLNSAGDKVPDYQLDQTQRQSLVRALGHIRDETAADRLEAPLSLQLMQFNCYGCHERNDRGGVGRFRKAYFETVGNVDIGDEGRLPPPLTAVGRKLKPAWLKKVFDGSGRIRPFMRIQMPSFPATAMQRLSEALLQADPSDVSAEPKKQPELAAAGRTLFNTGCVQCHPLRNAALPGVVGIDLQSPESRLQPGWFHDFLLDPASLKPRTRMPTFFKGGVGQLRTVLDGNADRQIDALWTYLNDASQPLPERIQQARSQNYELTPRQRPILLRTFMKEAGTHAIAVGFPQDVHFAFDAEQVRPAFAWRGRFLDALGTWFVRFAPPAEPLGEDGIRFPSGPSIARLPSPATPWPAADAATAEQIERCETPGFKGYRLQSDGTPTFLYALGDQQFQDTLTPHDGGWLREISVTVPADRTTNAIQSTTYVRLLTGDQISGTRGEGYQADTGLRVKIDPSVAAQAVLRETASGRKELLLAVAEKPQSILKVIYQW